MPLGHGRMEPDTWRSMGWAPPKSSPALAVATLVGTACTWDVTQQGTQNEHLELHGDQGTRAAIRPRIYWQPLIRCPQKAFWPCTRSGLLRTYPRHNIAFQLLHRCGCRALQAARSGPNKQCAGGRPILGATVEQTACGFAQFYTGFYSSGARSVARFLPHQSKWAI